MDFAAKLFDTPFEWVDGDPARQDLVGAQRVDIPAGPLWGPLGPDGYLGLAALADPAAALMDRAAHDPAAAGLGGRDAALLLAHEQAMARLRILLAAAPRPFTELAAEVFTGADGPRAEAALAALVSVGAKIRDSTGTPGAVGPLPPVRPGHRGRVHVPEPGPPARVTGSPRDLPGLPRHRVRVRLLQAVRRGVTWLARWSADPAASASRRARSRPDRRTWLLLGDPEPRSQTRTTRSSSEPRPLPPRTPCCAGAAGRCTWWPRPRGMR